MATPTALPITAGLPFARRIRVTDGKEAWPTLNDFEVRAQVRKEHVGDTQETPRLLFDFTPYISAFYGVDDQANDIIIELVMTGAQTKYVRSGKYDIIISDPGTTDARAIRALYGAVTVTKIVTGPEG